MSSRPRKTEKKSRLKKGRLRHSYKPASKSTKESQRVDSRQVELRDAHIENAKPHRTGAVLSVHVGEQPSWASLSDKKLLDMRVCDLDLKLEATPMVEYRDRLHAELKERQLRLRPHCWFSDEWFSPDNIPGIAIPFYMAHRRLMRLERKLMAEVEGGTREWCMRILRHEAGHAMDTAYRLHRRKKYKAMFGNYSDPYPDTYRPRPRSKKFVLHLEPWYAQSHPAEDFAETFAVWLKPRSRWRKEYAGWAALKKIELVDEFMQRVSDRPAKVKSRAKVDPVHRMTKTLRQHYDERHTRYSLNTPSVFDADLKKLFTTVRPEGRGKTAAAFLQKHRAEFGRTITRWTGEYRYNINQVLREMVERCRALKLYVDADEDQLKQDLLLMITVHTMNYLHAGHRVAL
ncbi:MAG: putative zinc-binding metallopeptidase [Planctomycetota bacterium]